MRAGRPGVWLLTVAVLAVGCAGPELSRTTYPRTRVPAGVSTGPGATVPPTDPERLSARGLRLIDPCGLLDTGLLATFGTPAENTASDYDTCRNYMETPAGESLSFTVRVGESTTSGDLTEATERVGGFRARRSTVEGACFVTLLVEEPEPDLGVDLQVGLEGADPCGPALPVAEGVAARLRAGAELRAPEPGSLLAVDPCAVPEDLPGRAVAGVREPEPYGLHQCAWSHEGSEVELRFAVRLDPAGAEDKGEPVDLGAGVTGYRAASSDTFPSCDLEWLHRRIGEDGRGDVVTVRVRDIGKKGFDVCAAAQTFGAGLVPTLSTG